MIYFLLNLIQFALNCLQKFSHLVGQGYLIVNKYDKIKHKHLTRKDEFIQNKI